MVSINAEILLQSTSVGPWTVADAVFSKDQKRASNTLNSLYKFASEDPTIQVLGALMKGVERLFIARSLLDKGASSDEIATRMGMHPYRYRMSIQPQVDKQSLKGLVCAMKIISDLDVDLKRSSHKRTLLELAVLNLATT